MKEFTMPMPVQHGAPTEYEVCTEWDAVDKLDPISSSIGQQCIQMEANIPTDRSIDALLQEPKTIHLIEIDSIASDSVYTHVTHNDEICHAKLGTGAQINVMRVPIETYLEDNQVATIPKIRHETGWLWQ